MFKLRTLIKEAVEDAIRSNNINTFTKGFSDGYNAGKQQAMKYHLNSAYGSPVVYADTDTLWMNTPPRFTPEEREVMTLACRILGELSDSVCGQITCTECKLGVQRNGKGKCLNNLLNDIRRKYS